jgi:hypothetical protein
MTQRAQIKALKRRVRLLDKMLKLAIETAIQSERDGSFSKISYNNTRRLLEGLARDAIKKEDSK